MTGREVVDGIDGTLSWLRRHQIKTLNDIATSPSSCEAYLPCSDVQWFAPNRGRNAINDWGSSWETRHRLVNLWVEFSVYNHLSGSGVPRDIQDVDVFHDHLTCLD